MRKEVWRDVPDHHGYQVSNKGRVRAAKRGKIRIKAQEETKDGYLKVKVTTKRGTTKVPVHRMVCAAFHGYPLSWMVCNHKDGNKTNNTPENLEWVTRSENDLHAEREGLRPRGSKRSSSKLTEDQVKKIRCRAQESTYASLAREFGVSRSTISRIVNGESWSWMS